MKNELEVKMMKNKNDFLKKCPGRGTVQGTLCNSHPKGGGTTSLDDFEFFYKNLGEGNGPEVFLSSLR